MISFICAISCFILFGLIGILTYIKSKQDKIPMEVTPWDTTTSWLVYASLMISIINWAILSFKS